MRPAPRLALPVGILALASFMALDAYDEEHNFVGAFLLGPVVSALAGRPRQVLWLGLVAVAAVIPAGLWNDDLGDVEWFIRLGVVASGSFAAGLAANARAQSERVATESSLAEAQLSAILKNLAEAVTVQDAAGSLVYANQAAADLLDAGTPEQLLSTPAGELVDRFHTFNEDGSPIRLEQLPGRKVLAGGEAEPLLLRAINRRTGEERWRLTKATAVLDDTGAVTYAVNIIEDVTEVMRAERGQRLLAEASSVLASSLNYTETLQQVAHMAVPGFADWCAVSMPGSDLYFEQVAIAHSNPERLEFAAMLRERFPPRMDEPTGTSEVMRTGEPQLLTGLSEEFLRTAIDDEEQLELLLELGMRSALLVPMRAGLQTTGVITFVSAESDREFTERDLELAVELGRRAGVAVENARLFTERTEVSDSLQQGLLPPELPDMGHWSAAAHYQAASEAAAVGGDFYDAFRVDDGWMLFVGDVAGRGHAAATLTALARYTLRTAGSLTSDPTVALGSLNRALRERDRLSLCSACVIVLREGEDAASAEVLCAGHPPPFVVSGDEVRQVGIPGPMLGALDNDEWPSQSTILATGDVLLLYTDGVIDARGEHDRFGEERLGEALRGADRPAEAIERVRRAVNAFHTGVLGDDMAMLAVLRGEPAPVRSARLPEGPDAARAARRLVEDELGGVLDERTLADARLLVSEVVTNALRHGKHGGPITLTLGLRDGAARVEVRDPGGGFEPPLERPGPEAASGRGLMLVDMLADRWGVGAADGTCVWFELARKG